MSLKRYGTMLAILAFPVLAQADGFSFTDTKDRVHTLEGHRGKWVLVNLWATWCAPCLAEMPDLEALSKSKSELVVLGLAIDGQNAGRVEQFAEKLHVTYPIIPGNAKMALQFKPKGYPTSILYDTTGQQVMVKEGPIDLQAVENFINHQRVSVEPAAAATLLER